MKINESTDRIKRWGSLSKKDETPTKMGPKALSEVIRNRRSIFPGAYSDQPIPKAILEEILENANWAPNHRRTEPWRFRIFRDKGLDRLSQFLGNYYKENTPAESFSEFKYNKNLRKPLQSACVIAICMRRDPEERLPEWEEIAAVACAVQNMWLTASAYGIGSYWSSPKSIEASGELLGLEEGERCLGFFYMGYSDKEAPPGLRQPIADKVIWIEE
ncbi:MAG: nitroreductase [Bacteroidota bacterium]